MTAFPEISRIPFEGPKSKNPLAFRHYNADELVEGRTMRDHLSESMSFEDLAQATHAAATELYGDDSREVAAVEQAWNTVLELDGNRDLFDGTTPAADSNAGLVGAVAGMLAGAW